MKRVSGSEYGTKEQNVPNLLAFRGLGFFRQLLWLLLLLLLCPVATEAETVTGRPYVTDGDTVKISGERIRLQGIDTPETNQRCKDSAGKSYGCGLVSTAALRNKIGRNSITCEGSTRDRYGRLLAICYLGKLDLNSWLVRDGHALAYRRYSQRYVAAEQEASEAGRGLWAGEFVSPWDWRKGKRLTTTSNTPIRPPQ